MRIVMIGTILQMIMIMMVLMVLFANWTKYKLNKSAANAV